MRSKLWISVAATLLLAAGTASADDKPDWYWSGQPATNPDGTISKKIPRKGKYALAIIVGYLLSYVTFWGYLIAGGAIAAYILSWLATSAGPHMPKR